MKIAQTDTAIAAFYEQEKSGTTNIQRARILKFIKDNGGDWSIGELAHALNMEKSTVSGRINEMIYATGELEEKCKRRDMISNRTIRAVGIPDKPFETY